MVVRSLHALIMQFVYSGNISCTDLVLYIEPLILTLPSKSLFNYIDHKAMLILAVSKMFMFPFLFYLHAMCNTNTFIFTIVGFDDWCV